MKKFFEPWLKYSTKEKVQSVGGFLTCMYAPLLIGLIWFDPEFLMKIIITNAILIVFIWLFDRSL